MLLNLTDVFTSEGKADTKTVSLELTEFQCRSGRFQVVGKSPVQIRMSNLGVGKALITGNVSLTLQMLCDRCLTEVPVELKLDFSREVSSENRGDADLDEENQDILEADWLNVEALINSEILMNLPEKVLCRPDCRGICRICGHNLNNGECGCDDFVPDPRMAAIKDIFNEKREV